MSFGNIVLPTEKLILILFGFSFINLQISASKINHTQKIKDICFCSGLIFVVTPLRFGLLRYLHNVVQLKMVKYLNNKLYIHVQYCVLY